MGDVAREPGTLERFADFGEFWPHYLAEHGNAGNRWLHFAGTLLALVLLVAAVVMRWPLLVVPAIVLGYGLSWIGHFVVERNRPATLRHPLWSLRADLKMFGLMLAGRLGRGAASDGAGREAASRARR